MILPEGDPALVVRLERARSEAIYLERCFAGAKTLLDIGCGPAVTPVLLAKAITLDHIYLMDGGPARMRESSWFDDAPRPWTDLALASRIACMNDVSFTLINPDPEVTVPCDAIMSLLSWGHHYPVRVYIGLARRSLPIGGKLVIDLREGRGGAEVLLSYGFRMIAQLDETAKLKRYLFERVN